MRKNAEQVHKLIQEYSIDAGEKVGLSELLSYVKEVLEYCDTGLCLIALVLYAMIFAYR